jgi:hypothetical protein
MTGCGHVGLTWRACQSRFRRARATIVLRRSSSYDRHDDDGGETVVYAVGCEVRCRGMPRLEICADQRRPSPLRPKWETHAVLECLTEGL